MTNVTGPRGKPPRKSSTGQWLGIFVALCLVYAWGHGSDGSSAAQSSPPADTSAYALASPEGETQQSIGTDAALGSDGDSTTIASQDTDDHADAPVTADADSDDASAYGSDADTDDSGEPAAYAGSGTCSDDYYLASSGDCVHRPEVAATAPDGASARCSDGTYSFSEHRSGTCSHHGGVDEWL